MRLRTAAAGGTMHGRPRRLSTTLILARRSALHFNQSCARFQLYHSLALSLCSTGLVAKRSILCLGVRRWRRRPEGARPIILFADITAADAAAAVALRAAASMSPLLR